MNNRTPKQILSRLAAGEFFDRQVELMRLRSLAGKGTSGFASSTGNAVVLGPPRVGKSELLRTCFDQLFEEREEVLPFYYAVKPYYINDELKFARDYLAQFLSQFAAFRRSDPRLMASANEALPAIAHAAPASDYLWVRGVVDAFTRASERGDSALALRCALSAPAASSQHTQLTPFVLVDNYHLLASAENSTTGSEFRHALSGHANVWPSSSDAGPIRPAYALAGLRRPIVESMPPDDEFFRGVDLIRVDRMADEPLEQVIQSVARRLSVEVADSTAELMIQQLQGDLFYIRSVLDAAASSGSSLRTFIEFERVYTEEVLNGRISHYLGALLRDITPDARARRAVLEALSLIIEANAAVPLETVTELMSGYSGEVTELLARMHSRELLDCGFGFVNASADSVLADYVRTRYRSEVAGTPRPVAGDELLGDKLKQSYRLMMSRYNHAIEAQLVESLSQFDFQSVPSSLFSERAFEESYRGMSRVQVRRALAETKERIRLPQIVLVTDLGSGEQPGMSWRLFAARGFEGGIYSDANEVLWLIAVINSREPLDGETLGRIDQKLKTAARSFLGRVSPTRTVQWYVSKEGFSAIASERLGESDAYRSTYTQLDFLQDHLIKLGSRDDRKPASEFELVIPIEDEAELIAARTVEQIARAADFEQEAINHIKTALIEACINAAEHSDSPDRRIHHRFSIDDDRLVITVSNKGKSFEHQESASSATAPAGSLRGSRGRGLQIIRALMDEVRFQPADGGTSLVMTKYLRSPRNKAE